MKYKKAIADTAAIFDDVCNDIRNGIPMVKACPKYGISYDMFVKGMTSQQKEFIKKLRAEVFKPAPKKKNTTIKEAEMKHGKSAEQMFESLTDEQKKIIEKAATLWGLKPYQLMLKTRLRAITEPRTAVYKAFQYLHKYNPAKTGSIFGLDRTTVIHGIETSSNLCMQDEKYKGKLSELLVKEYTSFTAMTFKPSTN